jgi:hypothetical protein
VIARADGCGEIDAKHPQRRMLVIRVIEKPRIVAAVRRRDVAAERQAAVGEHDRFGRKRLRARPDGAAQREHRQECRSKARDPQ